MKPSVERSLRSSRRILFNLPFKISHSKFLRSVLREQTKVSLKTFSTSSRGRMLWRAWLKTSTVSSSFKRSISDSSPQRTKKSWDPSLKRIFAMLATRWLRPDASVSSKTHKLSCRILEILAHQLVIMLKTAVLEAIRGQVVPWLHFLNEIYLFDTPTMT